MKGPDMEKRTSAKQVNFRRPFYLSALPGAQPAGSYTVRVAHEPADPSIGMGWRRTEIILELVRAGRAMDIAMSAQEVREALVQDGDQGTDPPASPGIAKRQERRGRRPF